MSTIREIKRFPRTFCETAPLDPTPPERKDFVLSVWEERKVRLYDEHANVHQSHSQNDSGDLRGVAGGDGELGVCVVRQAPVICVMVPPIHLGAWSMALMLWLPFELLLLYGA